MSIPSHLIVALFLTEHRDTAISAVRC